MRWCHVALPLTLTLVGGCAAPSAEPDRSHWPFAGQDRVVEGDSAVVVSGHPLASAVGVDILRQGGNAVDAAVAVGLALAVVHPEAGNVGGGGFMVYRSAEGEVRTLDYRETAPAAAHRDMYLDLEGRSTDRSVTGHLSVGVPGAVAGLREAHRALGRLPWADLVAPAIRLAREGFVIDSVRHASIASDTSRLNRFPASAAAFVPGGAPPAVGATFQQPDLARTLEQIRDRGDSGFYHGPVADLIVEEMRRGGGLITHADLAGYRAIWREPIRITYRDHTIYSMGPASSGGVTLALILNTMSALGTPPGFGSADLLHLEAEGMRRAFMDRNRWLGDPAFVQMPIERLTSTAYAESLATTIDRTRATPTPPFAPTVPAGASTTHYSIVDAEGNAVSITTTLNNSYGSAVTVTGGGFLLNDEMDDFATAPGQPNMYGLVQGENNAIAPGKRMLSAMTPTIVLNPLGELFLILGTPGGPTIITQIYHVLSNVVDHGMRLADAIAAPRMHHQALPDKIMLEENAFAPETRQALEGMGHLVQSRGRMGDVEAIIRQGNRWQGVSDPRRGGGGAAY